MKKIKIAVVTLPIYGHNEVLGLENILDLLEPWSTSIILITGNFQGKKREGVTVHDVMRNKKRKSRSSNKWMARLAGSFIEQIKIVDNFVRSSHQFDTVIFHVGVNQSQLAILAAKILRKKVVIYQFGGNYYLEAKLTGTINGITALLSFLNYPLCDAIILEGGEHLAKWDGLERYRKKIFPFVARYVDTNYYAPFIPFEKRPNQMGYFGRLTGKKGIEFFIEALPIVLKRFPNVKVVIAGTGELKERLEQKVVSFGLDKNIFRGFVNQNELPEFYNQFRLLIYPTLDDGIPEVVKEALSCCTPVAVTPVGGILDLLKDGKNVFIIPRPSKEAIAETICRALSTTNLSEMGVEGRSTIIETYSFNAMSSRVRELLSRLSP